MIGLINAASAKGYERQVAAFLKVFKKQASLTARVSWSNTAGRKGKMIDCRRWQPISYAAKWR